jgi:hypothetical protein
MLESDYLDLKIDPETGDLAIGPDGGFVMVSGREGVAQLVRIRLKLFKDEWFLNLDAGVPYYDEILGEKFSDLTLRRLITEQIMGKHGLARVPGVVGISSLGIEYDARLRRAIVTWIILTEFGDTEPDRLTLGRSPSYG